MAQLLRAAANGDLEKVISQRDQWNYQNKKGETVLHVAVVEDQLEIVKHLVSHGMMLNMQDKKNRFTPLMLCLAQKPPHYLDMMQLMLKAKADLQAQDSSGQTVLHLAAQYEEYEALEMILRFKPKVDAVDGKKMTPLHVAAGKANLDLLKLLVERGGANLDAVDGKGNTPCHWVCIRNGEDALECLEYLISKGAKCIKNSSQNTPLHSEAMHCKADSTWPTLIAQCLVSPFPGIDSEENEHGMTAAQLFEKGTSDDDVSDALPASSSNQSNEIKKRTSRAESKMNAAHQENAAAARSAAIARAKKKTSKAESSSSMSTGLIVALVLILLIVLSILFPSASSN